MEGHPLPNPPGYSLFLALIYIITGGSYLAARYVQIFIGLVNILLIYLIGKRVLDYRAGLFSALGVATYWAFVYYDMELNQVTIYITINLLCFYLLLQAYQRQKIALLSLAGIVFGFGAWFRGEVFLLTFPISLFVVFLFFERDKVKKAIIGGAIFFIFGLLPIIPLASYNYYRCGAFTSGSHNAECSLSIAFHPETPEYASYTPEMLRWLNKTPEDTVEIFDLDGMTMGLGKELGLGRRVTYKEWKDYLISGAIENIKKYPWLNFKKCVRRFLWTFSPLELDENKVIHYEREVSKALKYLPRFPLPMTLFILSIILLFVTFVTGKNGVLSTTSRKYLLVVFLFLMTNIGVFSLVIAGSRYRVSLIPYFFLLGGIAFSYFWNAIENKKWNSVIILGITFCVVFLLTHIPFFDYQPNRSRWLDERRKCYQRTGQLEEGVRFFEGWLTKNSDADAHYHAGVLCYELNQLDRAEEHFKKCLELQPEHPSAPYNLGLVYAKKNDWETSLKYFEQAVERNPNKADMWFATGWAYEQLGNTESALKYYRHALDINPKHPQALNHSAMILFHRGDEATAKEYLQQAVTIAPNYSDAKFNLGQVLLAERRPAEALKCFTAIVGQYQPEYELLKSIGLCYVQMLDYQQALQYLLKAKEMNPAKWDEESTLAVCYAGLGMRNECIQAINNSEQTKLTPQQIFQLGHALELLEEWDKAEKYYKSVLEKDDNHADSWAGLGNIYLARGDKDRAYQCFNKALQLNRYQFGAWFNVILQLMENQKWEEAKTQLVGFIEYYPEHIEAYYNLGLVYEVLADIENARKCFDKVLEKQTNHPGALFSRGTIALNEMDLEYSQNLFERLLPMESFKASYHLGIIHSLKEEWEKAHKYFLQSFFIDSLPFFNEYIYAFNIGLSFDRLGCLDEAEEFYRVSLGINSEYVELKDAYSFLLLRKGYVEESYLLLNTVFLYHEPKDWCFYHFSLVWEKLDEPSIALSFAQQANAIMPNQPSILHQLGGLYRKLGEHKLSEKYLEQARKLNPDDATILKTLAFLRSDQERFKDAEKLFQECIKFLVNDSEVYEGLADIYVKMGELKQAETYYRKSLEIQERPSVVNKLGLLLADLNKIEESIGLLELAIKYFPENAITMTRLADLKVMLHSDMEAKSLYERALALDSNNYLTHRNYADLLVRMGEHDRADNHYKTALELHPKDYNAIAGLGLLYARMNNYEQAKKYLLPLAQVKTDLLPVNQQLAQIFLSENQPEQSIKYIKRCILAQPDRKEFRELLQQATQMMK